MLRKAMKKGIRMGLKVAALSAKEGIKVLRPMVQGGKLSAGEAKRMARKFARVAERQARKAQAVLERKMAAELRRVMAETRRKKRR